MKKTLALFLALAATLALTLAITLALSACGGSGGSGGPANSVGSEGAAGAAEAGGAAGSEGLASSDSSAGGALSAEGATAAGDAAAPAGTGGADGTSGADGADGAGLGKSAAYGGTKLVLMVAAFGDLSFMDAARSGVARLEEIGFSAQYVECGDDSSKYQSYVLDICDSGADYLICGATYMDYVENVADDYPDMRFILFDTSRTIESPKDNVFYISYAQNEGAYLAGYVAAAISESGVISTIGGMQNPTICDFMVGYAAGASDCRPDVKVLSAFMGTWTDTAMMRELYTSQFNMYKADVCFPLSGNAGVGGFVAAHELGAYAIGVDSDQYMLYSDQGNAYAESIVTSMLKEVGNSIYATVTRVFDGGYSPFGTAEVMGLSTGSVGLVENDRYRAVVPEDVRAKVSEAARKIASGEASVPSYYDFGSESEYTQWMNNFAP
jgi:basic membrane protein A